MACKYDGEEEVIRALRKSNKKNGVFDRLCSEFAETTSSNQMIIGMTLGWMSGFCALKIGRTAIMALGGGLILLQIANENDLIKIDWRKVNENFDTVKCMQEKEKALEWVNKISPIAEKYTSFSNGFLGGFLISLAAH